MKKIITLFGGMILLIGVLYSSDVSAAKWIVTVQDYFFSPANLPNVVVGDTIEWEWVNGTHTTTSTTIPAGAATWDSPISSTNTSFEYKVTVAGTYDYQCSIHAGLGMIGSFTAAASSGIADNAELASINISPNPFKDVVKIQFASKYSILREIKIYDLTGKVIRTLTINSQTGNSLLTYDLRDLEKGLDLFRFIDDKDQATIRRVIRN